MSACTFFGHRQCHGLDSGCVCDAVEALIGQGVDTFYVGNQGQFDALVYRCLKQLQQSYGHIRFFVVLAYFPTEKEKMYDFSETIFPEKVGSAPAKFAIDRRNKWMLEKADWVICYVRVPWGGAYKFAELAEKQGKRVINLCVGGEMFDN